MNQLIASPPVAFLIILVAVLGSAWTFSRLAFRQKNVPSGFSKPYACGEDVPGTMIQPNYSQFLPFAFFFTILHVVALTVATALIDAHATLVIAILYLLVALIGLSVLYRK
jgi:hypothetical protein